MNTKKYVSLDKLGLYDEKIKKVITDGDAAALASANAYADSLAVNYDAAGSAATVQGKLDAEVSRAKAAEEANAAAAKQAQDEVDALELYVGTIPTTATATDIVGYVQEKTAGIATDAALTELAGRVTTAEGAIDAIEADYLKAADKTELSDAIKAEKERAMGIEGGLRTDVDAVKADYLKAADKTELQGNIDAVAEDVADIVKDYLTSEHEEALEGKIALKADQTALDAEIERATGVEESLQTQINTIMNNPDAEGAINSINEFTQYVIDHGTIADGFRTDINKNKEDIAAMDTAYKAADTAIQGRLDVLEAIDHDAYKAADEALEGRVNAEIAKKADATALTQAVEALEGADTAIKGRLDVVEAALGTGEGSVADQIADAKQEAIDAAVEAAAADATSKANAAEAAAKGHADSLNGAMDTRVAALETASATHALASDLTALAGRVTTAEGEIDTLQTEMDAVEALAEANKAAHEANAAAIALKASQADLNAVSGRVTAIEEWHENFVEVSEAEINALFA